MGDKSWGPQAGPRNPQWKGGRTVTTQGHVLIKRPDHQASDVRGYIYEHRLVAEQMLGRPLEPGERVRHVDGDPGNNDPANLYVTSPRDQQAIRECACGCGEKFTVLDQGRRPRRFVSGHNGRRAIPREGHRPRWETGLGLSEHDRDALLEDFDGRCAYGCGRAATCWDHVIAWAAGGTFKAAGNAVPACAPCNQAKSDRDPWPWIDRGMESDQADAWDSLLGLALGWGELEVPEVAA